jgi:(p)ppGpp synthase/HD superfamily hydrolase
MNKLDLAKKFCIEKHINQKRKYTGEPYHVHPFSVMAIVKTVPHDENMLIASLLHDTVEDTDATIEEVQSIFGDDVASLVSDLTDISKKEDGNRAKRKAMDLAHTKTASVRAKTIKLADLIDNSDSIVRYDPDFARVFMHEKARLLDVLKDGDKTLYNQAIELMDNYYKNRQ